VLVATLRGARGSRVRLLHGLTGTKAVRRRRARTPIFIPQGGPAQGHDRLFRKGPLGCRVAQAVTILGPATFIPLG
jgi:hypothetical protein